MTLLYTTVQGTGSGGCKLQIGPKYRWRFNPTASPSASLPILWRLAFAHPTVSTPHCVLYHRGLQVLHITQGGWGGNQNKTKQSNQRAFLIMGMKVEYFLHGWLALASFFCRDVSNPRLSVPSKHRDKQQPCGQSCPLTFYTLKIFPSES